MNFGKFLRKSFPTEHLPATAYLLPMQCPFINHPYIKTRSSSKNTKKIIKAKTLQVNERHIHDTGVHLRLCQVSVMEFW